MAIALDRYGNLEKPLRELSGFAARKMAIEVEDEDFSEIGGQKVSHEDRKEPRFDDPPSLVFLIRALETPGVSGIATRRKAAETLGKLGLRETVDSLIKVLGDKSWRVRETAAGAIGMIEPDRGVQVFIQALVHENWRARKEGAMMLGKLGKKRALLPLSWALRDTQAMVRRAAVKAISKIGGKEAMVFLITALDDEAKSVRDEAMQGLIKLINSEGNDLD